tara:strand:+ start:1363 stop:2259 length:897 start_codon:yes stop_codon:yes gene_type:complete
MITNKHGLPDSFLNYARSDKYSRGDADISVTQLIDAPQVLLLREKHQEETTTDVMDMIFALFGTAVHSVLETGKTPNVVKEQRLYDTVRGWKISGAIDQYEILGDDLVITDYKVTSVWSVMFDKQEWINQLNVYAYLLEVNKQRPVTNIKICAILRDWNRTQARLKPDYPQHPVAYIDIPLWSMKERIKYVNERVTAHQDARQMFDLEDGLTPCSDKERWAKEDKWAVIKKGNKKAFRVFNNKQDAENLVYDLSDKLALDVHKRNHDIEFRKGEYTRCKSNYCGVADFCQQYKETTNE